jgi:hypothetical protein
MDPQNESAYALEVLTPQERLLIVAASLRSIGINATARPPKACADYRLRSLRQSAKLEG